MRIDHIAIWVKDLEIMKEFYSGYFNMHAGEKYLNESKGFSSYFLSSGEEGSRLELMNRPGLADRCPDSFGYTHIAISVGSREEVDRITEILRKDNFTIASLPRITGDGYYESVILDPEGNLVEITS
ncbi:MAG: VOC family protein [Bacteroidales bacterium]